MAGKVEELRWNNKVNKNMVWKKKKKWYDVKEKWIQLKMERKVEHLRAKVIQKMVEEVVHFWWNNKVNQK